MYVYEARYEKCEDGCYAEVPAVPEAYAGGETLEEAIAACAEVLKLSLAARIDNGDPLPKRRLSEAPQVVLCVDVPDDFIAASKCMTITAAAGELGITRGRVSQLLDSGGLEAYQHGGKRMVTIASVEARKKNPPESHRPRRSE